VPFEELVFPDEIHDFLLRRSWVRAYSAGADFLDRKIGPGAQAQHAAVPATAETAQH
jgi:hypothetical protein